MGVAQRLALRGLGRVAPNPSVGCLIVNAGRVIGRGHTEPSGRPHAETVALAQAGEAARGATAYVTLEPCAHTGKTSPCADALITAGVSRVVIACQDPDPRVSGRGIERLIEAGVSVALGVGQDDALRANAGFLLTICHGRPLFSLKSATSLDGKIATNTGHSQWITGEDARDRGHLLRATHDAILIGSETALADNPLLSCRLPGMGDRSPLRVILDSSGRTLDSNLELIEAGATPTWVFVAQGAAITQPPAPHKVFEVAQDIAGRPSALGVAQRLAEEGITRVLIEGGAAIAAAFLQANLIDHVHTFRAPFHIGADGHASIEAMGLTDLNNAHRFTRTHLETLGADVYEAFERENLLGLLAD